MSHRTHSGLTLVEVMLAMAILGISVIVLTTAASRCLAVARLAKHYYGARYIMDLGELEHPVSVEADPDEKNKEKVYNLVVSDVEYPAGYTFSRQAERDERFQDLYVVKTRVSWSMRGKRSFEEVSGFLYYTNDLY